MSVIYAIPGFACTEDLFRNINVPNHTIKVLKWPAPQKHFTLKDYAKEFSDQIDQRRPFYLMGVSFGGMLCAELSEIVNAEKVILISSAKNSGEIPAPIKLLRYIPLHVILPEALVKKIAVWSRSIIGFPKEFIPAFKKMLEQMPANYYKYCSKYIINWNRKDNAKKLIHLHGNNDRLLYYRNIKKPDYTIAGGNHAMVMFRAEEINIILSKILDH